MISRVPLRGRERGSGTILLMTVVIFMLVLAAGFGVVGRYIVANHQARAAADLAALAGARAYGTGADGCLAAAANAIKNRHKLVHCDIVGDPTDFVITTKISQPVPIKMPGLRKTLVVQAHAGPVR
ncbi:Rv3654c family TadE-like protein [Microlunatus soli]|uniref:Helicase/secretion neighborhood TadE-like protein n=1 Tax=Microlunatus soli TaxID=630515 RepID=A0A1H1SXE3_9ACTN|nr:Rv3654c family TadE-like protein [Microlunatus soli]SDS52707.1 helicase/secretion neighborhood TadE-like protein [Microlunatus soli]